MAAPNVMSVHKAMAECDGADVQEFLNRHASGVAPRAYYLRHADKMYPLKALWAAAHRPSIHTREFTTQGGRRGLKALGFTDFVGGPAAEQYQEGARYVGEAQMLSRNAKLVADAKAHYGTVCKACGFDFEAKYGLLGAGYIECHHIDPLSGRGGKNKPTTLADVTVLCANCHRMIHKKKLALTVAELQAAIQSVQAPPS